MKQVVTTIQIIHNVPDKTSDDMIQKAAEFWCHRYLDVPYQIIEPSVVADEFDGSRKLHEPEEPEVNFGDLLPMGAF